MRFYCLKIRKAYSFDGLALDRRPSILGEQKTDCAFCLNQERPLRTAKEAAAAGRSSRRFGTMDASHAVSRRKTSSMPEPIEF